MGTGPVGSFFGENSFYRGTRSTRRGGRHLAKRSFDPTSNGTPLESQENVRDGTGSDCRRVLWIPGPQCQCFGKFQFIEIFEEQDEGVAMWLNVVLIPTQQRKAKGESCKSQERDRVGTVEGSSG